MTNNSKYNVRELSYQVLMEVVYNSKLLNTVVDQVLQKGNLSDADKAYVRRETKGVIENVTTLDEYIQKYTLFNIKKVCKEVLTILRIGTYELLFMDKVPAYATVSECVQFSKKYTKHFKYHNQYKYVNAVLRKIDQELNAKNIDINKEKTKNCYFRIYNDNELLVLNELNEKGISYSKYDGALDFRYTKVYKTFDYKSVLGLQNFKDGNILISDASSIFLTDKLAYFIKEREKDITNLKKTPVTMMKLLDVCAAPGGKILGLIDIIYNDYYYFYAEARDISDDKILKICENVNRLKVLDLNMNVKDASAYDELDKEKYDVVIADVPCSGLGVISKKPDTLMHFTKDKLDSLVSLQKKIIDTSSKYVKSGGILSYSTCTTTREENEEVIEDFLAKNENYSRLYEKRININDENNADGFYMCFMSKK